MPRLSIRRAGRASTLGFAAVLIAALTGCAGVFPDIGSSGSMPSVQSTPDSGFSQDSSMQGDPEFGERQLADGSMTSSAAKSIIRTSDIYIEVIDPQTSADQVAAAIVPMNGSIESSTVSASTEWGDAQAHLTVRVPADRLDEAITAISEVGRVTSESRSAQDVTLEQRDLEARVTALNVSIERLLGLMEEASNTADLLAAESVLTERQVELDALTSQLTYLEGQVSEATITVTLNAPGTSPSAGPANFWEAIVLGVTSLWAAIAGFTLGLGIALPWLVALAILAGVIIAIVRTARRRSARRMADQTASAEPNSQSPSFLSGS